MVNHYRIGETGFTNRDKLAAQRARQKAGRKMLRLLANPDVNKGSVSDTYTELDLEIDTQRRLVWQAERVALDRDPGDEFYLGDGF